LLLAPVTPNGTTSVDLDTILLIGVDAFLFKGTAKQGRVAVKAKFMNKPEPSIKYNSLNEGKAIAIKIRDGVIVQTSSKIVTHKLNLILYELTISYTNYFSKNLCLFYRKVG
jgi:hypothetical protein